MIYTASSYATRFWGQISYGAPCPGRRWDRWSFAREAPAACRAVVEAPWWERHGIELPNTIFKLRDIATLDEARQRDIIVPIWPYHAVDTTHYNVTYSPWRAGRRCLAHRLSRAAGLAVLLHVHARMEWKNMS
jgi:hypothetical protein